MLDYTHLPQIGLCFVHLGYIVFFLFPKGLSEDFNGLLEGSILELSNKKFHLGSAAEIWIKFSTEPGP